MRTRPFVTGLKIARKVDREIFVLLGGTAALLMQVAHPLVAAGVDRHSDFRSHPLARLMRTLDTSLAIVFGDEEAVGRAIARINRIHSGVHGTSSGGRPYDARDPRLLLWVQTTLVLTALRLYELVVGRLPEEERERFWEEMKPIGEALGIAPRLMPATLSDLVAFERGMLETEVIPDAVARAVGRDVLRPIKWLPDAGYWPSDALAAALLPPSLRSSFGLRYRTAERLFFRGVIVTVRWLRKVAPDRFTVVPQARLRGQKVRG